MTNALVAPFREVLPDGTLRLNMHPGQKRAFDSKARFVLVSAGTQGGKSVLGPPWLHREILGRGAGDYLAVTSTYDLFKLKMVPELLDYFEETLRVARFWSESRVIELAENLEPGKFRGKKADDPMWGRIILRSADAKGGLEAATVKGAWLDECGQPEFTKAAYEAVLRRVGLHEGRILHTTTLYHDGWFVHDVYQKAERGEDGYSLICFESVENPAYPRAAFELARRTMPSWKFEMFHRGRFKKAVGQVYDCFDEAQNVIKRFQVDPAWPVYIGHDFGPVNNAAVFYAYDPKRGEYYLYATYKPGEARETGRHIGEWKEITKGRQVLRRAGGSRTEEEIREGYGAQGWPIAEPSIRGVKEGILRVYALKKAGRIKVFEDLTDYLDEQREYSWKLDVNYHSTDEIEDKAHFHLMDAERYILGSTPREALATRRVESSPMWYGRA